MWWPGFSVGLECSIFTEVTRFYWRCTGSEVQAKKKWLKRRRIEREKRVGKQWQEATIKELGHKTDKLKRPKVISKVSACVVLCKVFMHSKRRIEKENKQKFEEKKILFTWRRDCLAQQHRTPLERSWNKHSKDRKWSFEQHCMVLSFVIWSFVVFFCVSEVPVNVR